MSTDSGPLAEVIGCIRGLDVDDDLRDVLLALAERVEQATAVEEVIARARGRRFPRPAPKRDRHGLCPVDGGKP
jgi:hypothetical protein